MMEGGSANNFLINQIERVKEVYRDFAGLRNECKAGLYNISSNRHLKRWALSWYHMAKFVCDHRCVVLWSFFVKRKWLFWKDILFALA